MTIKLIFINVWGVKTQSMDVRHEDTSASVVMVLRRVFSGRIRVTIFVVVGHY